ETVTKKAAAKRYNKRVIPRQFEQGDLVLLRADIGQRNTGEGKLAQNWEGPYRIAKALGKGGYKIETLQG
ncbi:putative reverse transcriptase, partial [Trifolium medium]|nr:putative reverse transcriptase [Trifolium medium]